MSEPQGGGGQPPPYCPKCCGTNCICPKPEPQAREWWIGVTANGFGKWLSEHESFAPVGEYECVEKVHVIEYAAFEQVVKERDDLQEQLDNKRGAMMLEIRRMDQLAHEWQTKYGEAREERDRCREALQGLRVGGCFCDVAIGDPRMRDHSAPCKVASDALK
jgi:hypothetical protein